MQLSGAAVAVIGGLVAFTHPDIRMDMAIAEAMAPQDLLVALLYAALQPVGLGNIESDEAEQDQDTAAVKPGPLQLPRWFGGGDSPQTPLRSSNWRNCHSGVE